jgi:hypothetical protein
LRRGDGATPAVTAGRPHGALGTLARVLPLAGQDDEEALAAALAELARELLGAPAAAVVATADADARADALRASHGEVAAVPLPAGAPPRILLLAGPPERLASGDCREAATAVAELAAAAFTQQAERMAERRRAALQAALATAGRSLQQSLDVSTLLTRICREAALVVGADAAVVWRAADEELVVEAAHGRPPEVVGWRMPAGAGVAGRALAEQRTLAWGPEDAGGPAAAGSP